ncbi:MAG: hypothetical protein HY913_04255 [Desulfomonile tiedjei]|nr:hypothetical protein [Desulfomonile tiedjei]
MTKLATQNGSSHKGRQIVEKYVESIPADSNGNIRLDQIYGLLDNLQRAVSEGDASFLQQKRGYKFTRVVDVIEFCESKGFFSAKREIWPSTKDSLWKIFHGDPEPLEVVLTGSAGSGKSSVVVYAFGYMSYLLGSLHSPHAEFDLMPSSIIHLAIQSRTQDIAQDAIFRKLKWYVDESPWFNEFFPRKKDINNKIIFVGSNIEIITLTGNTDSGLGKDIIACAITEAGFFDVVKGSVKLQHSDKQIWDGANEAYTVLKNRMETRFSRPDGGYWGKLFIDSSANYEGDFTDRKVEQARTDKSILVINRKLWESKPGYPPDEPRFLVQLPTDSSPARLLNSIQETDDYSPEIDPALLDNDEYLEQELGAIRVPVRHLQRFKDDIEQALKDLAGIRSAKTSRFIPFGDKISLASTSFNERTRGEQIFLLDNVSLRDLFGTGGEDVDWSKLINYHYLEQINMGGEFNFSVHVDASLSGDATGIAFTRIIDTVLVDKSQVYNQAAGQLETIENAEMAVYCVDGLLRIFARAGEHIELKVIQNLILHLKEYITIKYASADWMDLQFALQEWRNRGIPYVQPVSVDKSPASYFTLKNAIRDERVLWPYHEVMDREARRLQRIIKGGRIQIDHPSGTTESKDVIDAIAATVGVLSRTEARIRLMEKKEQEEVGDEIDQAPRRRVYHSRRGGRRY